MYLHQGLVDNIVLQTKKGIPWLESYYSYRIINKNVGIITKWYNYTLRPNNITKLCYQYSYSINKVEYYLSKGDWNYITGVLIINHILHISSYFRNKILFRLCINGGIKPTKEQVRRLIYNDDIEMFNKCINIYNDIFDKDSLWLILRNGNDDLFNKCIEYVKPDIDILNKAAIYGDKYIFRKCLESVEPDRSTIEFSIDYNQLDIFKDCLKYGLVPEDNMMHLVILHDNLEMFKICIEYKIKVTQKMLLNAAKVYRNCKIFDYCINELKIKPGKRVLNYLNKYPKLKENKQIYS